MSLQSGAGANLFLYSTILVGFLCLNGRFRAAGFVIAALGSDLLICQLLKDLFIRRRPTVVPPLTHFDCKSFPSGHSMGFALVYLTLGDIISRESKGFAAVALTAYARLEDRTEAIRAGFQNHLPKPVEPAELLAVVHSLATPRSRR